MMKLYPENFNVALDVLFTDDSGAPLAVKGVSAALYDGEHVNIADFGSIPFDPADTKVTITVPAQENVLGEGELSAARVVRVHLDCGANVLTRTLSYIIEAESRLEILNNTFLTLEAAEVFARDLPSLKAWSAADDDKKVAALINAYSRLSRVQLRYTKAHPVTEITPTTRPWPPGRPARDCDVVIRPGGWKKFTKEDFLAMPADFRKAIRLAQMIEANEILTDSPYEARHRAGVISETVGESSVMLRGGRLELGVSNQTLRALSGFVYYDVRIARA